MTTRKFWESFRNGRKIKHGTTQLELLVSNGLQPHHYVLDIGCGWLRAGISFIGHLDVGHYYGFDKQEEQILKGKELVEGMNLAYKKPRVEFVHTTRGIRRFVKDKEMRFDYMVAYSVFTHTDPYMTERLFYNTIYFLKDGGKFFATFFLPSDKNSDFRDAKGIFVGERHMNRGDEYRVVEYPFSFFEDLAHNNGMVVEHLSLREEAHGQDWMCFYKE